MRIFGAICFLVLCLFIKNKINHNISWISNNSGQNVEYKVSYLKSSLSFIAESTYLEHPYIFAILATFNMQLWPLLLTLNSISKNFLNNYFFILIMYIIHINLLCLINMPIPDWEAGGLPKNLEIQKNINPEKSGGVPKNLEIQKTIRSRKIRGRGVYFEIWMC